jgi:hypothetical protein
MLFNVHERKEIGHSFFYFRKIIAINHTGPSYEDPA